jgi:hypothetical protein
MNHVKIKELATKVLETLKPQSANMTPEQMIDAFVLEYTKVVLFEATDLIRENAKEQSAEVAIALKATAIDVLDHFGV